MNISGNGNGSGHKAQRSRAYREELARKTGTHVTRTRMSIHPRRSQ